MKLNQTKRTRNAAFTLVEMIGVLAVIAVLAAMLVPKIFEAINSSRINNAISSYETAKDAVLDHYAEYGRFSVSGGATALTAAELNFDTVVLLPEGRIDKPFNVKIGSQLAADKPQLSIDDAEATTQAPSVDNTSYDLDGGAAAPLNSAGGAQFVVFVKIQDVTAADAKAINDRLDGTTLSAGLGIEDLEGRVKYAASVAGKTDVYIYVAHR